MDFKEWLDKVEEKYQKYAYVMKIARVPNSCHKIYGNLGEPRQLF